MTTHNHQPDYMMHVWREPDGTLHVEARAYHAAAKQPPDAIVAALRKAVDVLDEAVDLHPGGAA